MYISTSISEGKLLSLHHSLSLSWSESTSFIKSRFGEAAVQWDDLSPIYDAAEPTPGKPSVWVSLEPYNNARPSGYEPVISITGNPKHVFGRKNIEMRVSAGLDFDNAVRHRGTLVGIFIFRSPTPSLISTLSTDTRRRTSRSRAAP